LTSAGSDLYQPGVVVWHSSPGSILVGMAVRRTDSAEEARVGIPDSSDSREDSEARESDKDASSEGELPKSVGELPKSVVAAA